MLAATLKAISESQQKCDEALNKVLARIYKEFGNLADFFKANNEAVNAADEQQNERTSMEIIDKRSKSKGVMMADLVIGDVFEYDGRIYIKTVGGACGLNQGESAYISPALYVTPVKATLTIERLA